MIKAGKLPDVEKCYYNPVSHQKPIRELNNCASLYAEEGLFDTWKDKMKDTVTKLSFEVYLYVH